MKICIVGNVVSRHPSRLVPSRFSCPFPWIPVREWVRREWKGRKSLNLCILRLKVPVNVKKLKEIAMKSQFWVLLLHFPSYFSLFWAVNSVLRCLGSRLDPSRFFEPSLDLSRPAKNLSRHNTSYTVNVFILNFTGTVYSDPASIKRKEIQNAIKLNAIKFISFQKVFTYQS